MTRPIVVKVGGSLYDQPDLGARLHRFLEAVEAPVFLVPGGGAAAEGVRELHRVHRLGEEAAHWLALRACTLNAHFLARLLPGVPVTGDVSTAAPWAIVDAFEFARTDDDREDRLPHHWDVTSDSLAVRVAQRGAARRLVLLKSCDWPAARTWEEAAAAGVVDRYFASALRRTANLEVLLVNLRTSEWR
jgi:aspartokinase-like uncharacterized kinase